MKGYSDVSFHIPGYKVWYSSESSKELSKSMAVFFIVGKIKRGI
jgi:hypothetical protein